MRIWRYREKRVFMAKDDKIAFAIDPRREPSGKRSRPRWRKSSMIGISE